MNLEDLIPLVRHACTAREFGAIVLANVDPREKHSLARAARDALGRTWSDTTVRYYMAPAAHGEGVKTLPRGPMPRRQGPTRQASPRPEPTRDFPPAILHPTDLVEAAWSDPRPEATQREAVVGVLVRMVHLNGGRTNLPHGWLPTLRARFASCGRPVPPRVLSWYRSQLQDDPFRFERVPGVDVGVLVALEDRFLR
jgi:hypothetical protein